MTGGSIRNCVGLSVPVLAIILLPGPAAGRAGAQQTPPANPATITARMDAAAKAGDLAAAAALAGQMIEATEEPHVEALYAAAQFQARLGHREQAYLFLVRSIGAGFWDRGRLLRDDAFVAFGHGSGGQLPAHPGCRGRLEAARGADDVEVPPEPPGFLALGRRIEDDARAH